MKLYQFKTSCLYSYQITRFTLLHTWSMLILQLALLWRWTCRITVKGKKKLSKNQNYTSKLSINWVEWVYSFCRWNCIKCVVLKYNLIMKSWYGNFLELWSHWKLLAEMHTKNSRGGGGGQNTFNVSKNIPESIMKKVLLLWHGYICFTLCLLYIKHLWSFMHFHITRMRLSNLKRILPHIFFHGWIYNEQ